MNLYSHFEEKGYRVEAYIPTNDADIDAFEIRVLIAGELKKTLYLRLTYLPVFGVDAGDLHHLEAFAAAMMTALPESSAYDDVASAALDAIEKKFGGAMVRAKISNMPTPSGSGQFDWTRDAFVAMVANVFGDVGAAEKWMGTAVKELGDRTPEEALRVGMGPEVIQYLMRSQASGGKNSS